MPESAPLERRCVVPFYLKMLGLNAAADHGIPIRALRRVARRTTDGEVTELLGSHWRACVMGAWFASGRAPRVERALLASLETSQGSFTAPPLATVALHGLGAGAVPSLMAYLRQDLQHEWGSASFVAAALERLDATPDDVGVDNDDREGLDRMLSVVRRLAEALPAIPPDAAARAHSHSSHV